MKSLLWELNRMWIEHSAFGGSEKVPYSAIVAKIDEIERFHYDELDRVREECTPATKADLRWWGGR